jgi:hypothetical protein
MLSFMATKRHEIGRLPSHEGTSLACIVADVGPLDLDDACPDIGENHGAVWARQNPPHVDEGNVIERWLLGHRMEERLWRASRRSNGGLRQRLRGVSTGAMQLAGEELSPSEAE